MFPTKLECLSAVIAEAKLTASRNSVLASGILSDVEVICKDRTWRLHRLVLIMRSMWMKKALCGHFTVCTVLSFAIALCQP